MDKCRALLLIGDGGAAGGEPRTIELLYTRTAAPPRHPAPPICAAPVRCMPCSISWPAPICCQPRGVASDMTELIVELGCIYQSLPLLRVLLNPGQFHASFLYLHLHHLSSFHKLAGWAHGMVGPRLPPHPLFHVNRTAACNRARAAL